MINAFYEWSDLIIQNKDKKEVRFNLDTNKVTMDWFDVSFPWEYEKSNILLEVKEYNDILFYNFLLDWRHLVLVTSDTFEIKEEILKFFGDVDLLFIVWSKQATKVFENIEAKVVIPYGEWKDVFLNTLSQHTEEVSEYKVKWELPIDSTEFVNLSM